MTNRIDQILAEVRRDVDERRSRGDFPALYEANIESGHDAELGKRRTSTSRQIETLSSLVADLNSRVSTISDIERDNTRFRPLRFLRELAMSRHQLVRMRQEMQNIADLLGVALNEVVQIEESRIDADDAREQELLALLYGRTQLLEKLVILTREHERQISILEQQ